MKLDFFNDPQILILGKFLFALFLGALIGLEREFSEKPAGLRTHMIVAGAACLLISLNDFVRPQPAAGLINSESHFLVDAIITGVSFLGAGTIIQRGGRSQKIQGLTTAGSLLLSAVVGIYVAFWKFWVASGVSVLTLLVLHSFWLERRIVESRNKNGKID